MKVSIITATYNSALTVINTLDSVKGQTHPLIEHILIDGLSSDNTVNIIKSYPHVTKWVSEKDKGLYDAINKGVQMATGDIIGVLNSDDFFPNTEVVSNIVKSFEKEGVSMVFGNVAFVRPDNLGKIIRLYSSRNFSPDKFGKGYMPAHPSCYIKADCYRQFGLYEIDYKIAADYELLMRFIYKYNINYQYLNKTMVYMRTGGISNENWKSRYILNKEIIKACKANGVNTNMAKLSLKYFNKVFEYINPLFKRNNNNT
jgi:glycosyltransferase involved in cell wall biosynthesis